MRQQFAPCEKKANEKLQNKYTITGDMMKVVYFELKVNIPIYHHPKLVNLMESLGVNLGYHHYDTRGAGRIADHITNQMHLELLRFLKADTSPLSIVVDGATDPSQNHFLCVFNFSSRHYIKTSQKFSCTECHVWAVMKQLMD